MVLPARSGWDSAGSLDVLQELWPLPGECSVSACVRERLAPLHQGAADWGDGFAVDASLIKADANRQKGIEGDKGLPPGAAGRTIDEYLAVLDDAAFGAATEVTPKFVSPCDPAARWTGAHGGQAFFAYSTNYVVDIENAIIVDVEATTAIRQAEVLAAKRMNERSLERFDLYPGRLLGNTGYGSAEMLGWLVCEHGIKPHVTVFDKSVRTDGTYSRHDFTYDHAGDVYRCPGGKALTTTRALMNDGATMLYVASKRDCDRCALKSRCCPSRHRGKYRARSTRAIATWRTRSQALGRAALRVGSARRLRCCSRTSSAFSRSTVYGYEAQTVRATSSLS